MFDRVYDVFRTVCMFLSVLVAAVAFFKARSAKKKAEATLQKEREKMAANDAATKITDKELKKMAKFRCDRCGAIDDVKNAESVDGFDLCGACANEVEILRANVSAREKGEKEAAEALELARQDLENFLHGNGAAEAGEETKQ